MLDLSWAQWTQEEIDRVVEKTIKEAQVAMAAVFAVPTAERTFANTIVALEHSGDEMADRLQQLELLANVHPEEEMRNAAQEAHARVEAAGIEMNYDHRVWQAVRACPVDLEQLDSQDKKLYQDTLRDLRRMGFELPPEKFERLKQNRQELQQLETEFEKVINEYEDFIAVTRAELDGLPERYLEGLEKLPDERFKVSLKYPDLMPYLDYATNAQKREELAHKSYLRGGAANLTRLAKLIELRQESARLLGYASHADFVTEVRMAGSSEVARGFVEDVLAKLKNKAQTELQELVEIKQRQLKLTRPEPILYYESAYWSEKLRQEKYQIENEKIKEYFPLTRVLAGVLEIYQSLLGLKFKRLESFKTWHPDVQVYAVEDAQTHQPVGHFLLDLYPRSGKFGHYAAFPVILGRRVEGRQVTGLVALVGNFPKPTQNTPSLLTHDEVETFLHEFGHLMHALLSGGRYQRQNGFGVAQDFVEALSQIFEYWAWDGRVLAKLSEHYQTGEPLPKELFEKMLAARKHQLARWYSWQASNALYDLTIHGQPTAAPVKVQQLAQLHRRETFQATQIELPEDAIYPAGWGHLADYDAGYYGYLWSKVYAADMFTRFEADPLDVRIGQDYRVKVLAPGSSQPEKQLVEDFLGRISSNHAFLAELDIS